MPDPYQFFSARQIADMSQCPIGSNEANWPRLVEQMGHCRINDRATQIAMIGTIAIETNNTFEPVREAYFLGEPEPAESFRQTLEYFPYYGRGFIQITLRSNYAFYGRRIAELWNADPSHPDFDLVGTPDKALDPDISAAVSALYFRDHGGDGLELIPRAARAGNWARVRELVLGATTKVEVLRDVSRAADLLLV